MAQLRLSRVSFSWGGPLLLDRVDLEIDQGGRIGLLGRNGSGKSTLMRMLVGEIDPDAGQLCDGLGQMAGVFVIFGQALDVVVDGVEGRGGENAGLSHPAAEHLAETMRAFDKGGAAGDDRSDRRAQSF